MRFVCVVSVKVPPLAPFSPNKNLFTNSMYENFFSVLSSSFCFDVDLFLFLVFMFCSPFYFAMALLLFSHTGDPLQGNNVRIDINMSESTRPK